MLASSSTAPTAITKQELTSDCSDKRKRTSLSSPSPSFPSPAKPSKRIKKEEAEDDDDDSKSVPRSPPSTEIAQATKSASTNVLETKKLKEYAQYASRSPFPEFLHPSPAETRLAHRILSELHGERARPELGDIKAPTTGAGCGESPSVLDALVRTILSQNTSDTNSALAKQGLDAAYGYSSAISTAVTTSSSSSSSSSSSGSSSSVSRSRIKACKEEDPADETVWHRIVQGGPAKLESAIRRGGLAGVKSRAILQILDQVRQRHGVYSLDHLFGATDEEAMRELLSFRGVGHKTASCVLLFCLRRESFAVDTHVWRISGLLGWRPARATRDETYAHLNAKIPDGEKYGLHVLMVRHGKICEECKAGGKTLGKCELRKAFRARAKEEDVVSDLPGDG
ncbi:DNA glycosylase [Sodiomyces alkalinus F11]|uniref:DNA glycosylase n=1 Tax=Sodiomyces alkalinus (strain CBS 110278 / VKM F-3762 / F11) TaxID=1314773 RepID=A0A3N2PX95_SODAK|nr:DNA glycosylase [Sodiomyces alkalinus F11]ROT38965.1 DNA glycosylase [Sodiomyces alkalinus F11]